MNEHELLTAYDKLKANLIQSPAAFDLLHEIIMNPKVATLNELIKYDSEKVSGNDGNELTKEVMKALTEICHVSPEEIFSRSRKREFTDARIIYVALLRMGTSWSLMKISQHLNRHHASMIHCLKQFASLSDTDMRFRKKVIDIIKILNSKKNYTFDELLTTNKWKYERTNANLERGARIARINKRANYTKRKENKLQTTNA